MNLSFCFLLLYLRNNTLNKYHFLKEIFGLPRRQFKIHQPEHGIRAEGLDLSVDIQRKLILWQQIHGPDGADSFLITRRVSIIFLVGGPALLAGCLVRYLPDEEVPEFFSGASSP